MCRERFEKLVAKEKEESGAAGGPAVPELEAGGSAERAAGSTAAQGVGITTPQNAGTTTPRDAGRTAPMDAQSGGQSSSSGLKRDGGDQPHGGSSATSPKKPRAEEQRGERRPAETDLEALEYDTLHAALLDPEPEIIAGQPTLPETPPVAHLADIMPTGYPDWANYDGAVDERTGEPLPEDKVKKGRGREFLKMESHNVKTDITWKQAKDMGLKIVKSRWV